MTPRLDYQAIAMPALRARAEVHRQVAQSSLSLSLVNPIYLRVHNRDRMEGVPLGKLMLLRPGATGDVFSAQDRAPPQWEEALTEPP